MAVAPKDGVGGSLRGAGRRHDQVRVTLQRFKPAFQVHC